MAHHEASQTRAEMSSKPRRTKSVDREHHKQVFHIGDVPEGVPMEACVSRERAYAATGGRTYALYQRDDRERSAHNNIFLLQL